MHDNAGLYHSLRSGTPVLPIFIFDTEILDRLDNKMDKRVQFIHNAISGINNMLAGLGSSLLVLSGSPETCFRELLAQYAINAVYTNHDYEPYALQRDEAICVLLKDKGIALHTYKDQVIFEKDEVLKDNGEPYTVFTPYSRKWRQKLNSFYLQPYPTDKYFANFCMQPAMPVPSLASIGFELAQPDVVAPIIDDDIARHYADTRDFPGVEGTSKLSVHLRFGTLSIRQMAARANELSATLLTELIWRDFYQMILWQFPHVVNGAFKREYDQIKWRNNEQEFALWCKGQTGFPIVDAGMRQLNRTGFMHNRVRMIVASFLTKHLLIDWQWGAAYFAEKLLDYDLAANNGGWQWAAGSGCDAAPYFRIFNPHLQTERFDPKLKYISRWVPEYAELTYPKPIVDHKAARDRCLNTYKAVLSKG